MASPASRPGYPGNPQGPLDPLSANVQNLYVTHPNQPGVRPPPFVGPGAPSMPISRPGPTAPPPGGSVPPPPFTAANLASGRPIGPPQNTISQPPPLGTGPRAFTAPVPSAIPMPTSNGPPSFSSAGSRFPSPVQGHSPGSLPPPSLRPPPAGAVPFVGVQGVPGVAPPRAPFSSAGHGFPGSQPTPGSVTGAIGSLPVAPPMHPPSSSLPVLNRGMTGSLPPMHTSDSLAFAVRQSAPPTMQQPLPSFMSTGQRMPPSMQPPASPFMVGNQGMPPPPPSTAPTYGSPPWTTQLSQTPQGEVDNIFPDTPEDVLSECDLGLRDFQTTTAVGDKLYVIGGNADECVSYGVRIFDRENRKWVIPTVLGTKPRASKGHAAVLLCKERILVCKIDSPSDDFVWFLEVDTPFINEQRTRLGAEVVAWSKGVIGDCAKPVVISGPSGVGKGTLISKLMKEFPSTFGFSVSHTTRSPRVGEKDGVHYHFTERDKMENDIREGKFLESASLHGNLYGTSIEAVEAVTDAGKRCILDIDVQGAKSVKTSSLEALFIFICPPSFEELEKRLRDRGTETEEQIQKRLKNAKAELEQGRSSGIFEHILINDDLEACYGNLKKILGFANGFSEATQLTTTRVELPIGYSLLHFDQKVLIHGGTTDLGKPSTQLCILDLASLKGGAPGRTRGLKLYEIGPIQNGAKQVNGSVY